MVQEAINKFYNPLTKIYILFFNGIFNRFSENVIKIFRKVFFHIIFQFSYLQLNRT